MLDILSFFCELRILLFTRFFLCLIKHFLFLPTCFFTSYHEENNDNSEDNTSLSAMVVVLDTAALKQDVILIFYCYLGQTQL